VEFCTHYHVVLPGIVLVKNCTKWKSVKWKLIHLHCPAESILQTQAETGNSQRTRVYTSPQILVVSYLEEHSHLFTLDVLRKHLASLTVTAFLWMTCDSVSITSQKHGAWTKPLTHGLLGDTWVPNHSKDKLELCTPRRCDISGSRCSLLGITGSFSRKVPSLKLQHTGQFLLVSQEIMTLWSNFFFGGDGTGLWIQGFTLTKQAFYSLSLTSSPFFSG
jgi:hypothetical protein